MRIVLDTNVIVRDPRLRGTTFRILLQEIGLSEQHGVILPKIVLDEAVNKAMEEISLALAASKKAARTIKKFSGDDLGPAFDLEAFGKAYRELLVNAIDECGGEVAPYPSVSHADVVERALRRRRPFSAAGDGYRDCLVWHTVLEGLREDDEEMAFISENTSDFATRSGTLHPDLIAELETEGFDPSRLGYYSSLQDFVDTEIKPTLDLVQDTLKRFQDGDYPFDLEDAIGLFIQDEYASVEWESHEIGAPEQMQSSHLSTVQHVHNIEIESVKRLNQTELLVELQAALEVEFYVYLTVADLAVLGEDQAPFITDWHWNDYVVEGSKIFPMHAALDFTYDTETGVMHSMTVKALYAEEQYYDD